MILEIIDKELDNDSSIKNSRNKKTIIRGLLIEIFMYFVL